MSDVRTEIREAFEKEQSAFPPPGALRAQIVAALNSHAGAAAQSPNRGFKTVSIQWAGGFVAVLLVVVLIAALVYSRSSLGPTGSASPGMRSTVERVFDPVSMMSPTSGWADPNLSGHPLRTTDGGAHWTNVSPPSVLVGGTSRTYFLDADRAWVAEASWGSVVQLVSQRTVDGGRTWQHGVPITLDTRSIASAGFSAPGGLNLNFLDPEHGWLFLDAILRPQPTVDEAHLNALYHTNDGGLHWMLLSTHAWSFTHAPATSGCPWGIPVFTSLTTGFMYGPDRTYEPGMTINCPLPAGPALHVTHDGGVTWQFQPLPAQFGASPAVLDAPDFVDQLHGFLVFGSGLLATSDGGSSWEVRSLPVRAPDLFSISWLDARNGWATSLTEPLYRTRDGGASWAPVQTNLLVQTPPGGTIGGLYFVDQDTGFAFYWSTETSGYSLLLKTADGGHTWAAVGRFN